MTYRLPAPATTSCTEAGCPTAAVHSDHETGTRTAALEGWDLGPETAICPSHRAARRVLDFASA